jgi:hypothetical protein
MVVFWIFCFFVLINKNHMTVFFSQVILHNRKYIYFIIIIKWVADEFYYKIQETNIFSGSPPQDKSPTLWINFDEGHACLIYIYIVFTDHLFGNLFLCRFPLFFTFFIGHLFEMGRIFIWRIQSGIIRVLIFYCEIKSSQLRLL